MDHVSQNGTGVLGKERESDHMARGACPAPRRPWRRVRAQGAQYCLPASGGTAARETDAGASHGD